MENISIYSEARNEYLKQLSTWIVPPLVEFFRTEYDRISRTEGKATMRIFQNFCAEVPVWNQTIIERNINKILDNCRCDYIEELMTAVFIAHTKMLTAIRVSNKQKKLSITLPKLDHFLHRVFTECARCFWKAPFLFAEDLTAVEKQKNILQAESMCIDAVSSAVRSLLPVKNILRDYLDEDEEEQEESVAKPVSKKKKPVVESDSESDSDSVDEAPVAPAVPAPVAPFAAIAVEEPLVAEEELEAPVVIEKLETPPEAPKPTISDHAVEIAPVKAPVTIEKMDTSPDAPLFPVEPAESANPPKLLIETEPAVHFTPYDTVFDENKPGVSEIRYTEKVSVEDKPPSNWGLFDDEEEDDDVPRLNIGGASSGIDLNDVEDLDAPLRPTGVTAVTPEEDIDAPLTTTGDFEELA
jgi:hypothetical protein